ncbi:MAG: hypothetical protein IPN81_14540 [Nitrosomonadales bacterium]|nr:hypothetical protein [Nitrosomonadales bacterium]
MKSRWHCYPCGAGQYARCVACSIKPLGGPDSRVDEAIIRNMLGAIDQSYLYDVLQTLPARDGVGLPRIADDRAKPQLGV